MLGKSGVIFGIYVDFLPNFITPVYLKFAAYVAASQLKQDFDARELHPNVFAEPAMMFNP